ncbi:MAG TPA: chromosome segregation protein SMC, partial [Cytophagales bacterium]|nr:chromosome segregation protein SMC [Cytophagales bacterium]
ENTHKNHIEKLRQEISRLEQEKASFSTRLEQVRQYISSSESKRDEMATRVSELQKDISETTPKAQILEAEIKVLQEQVAHYSQELSKCREQFNLNSATFNQENLLFHQLSNKVKSLEQEIGYKQSTFDGNKERIAKNQ